MPQGGGGEGKGWLSERSQSPGSLARLGGAGRGGELHSQARRGQATPIPVATTLTPSITPTPPSVMDMNDTRKTEALTAI